MPENIATALYQLIEALSQIGAVRAIGLSGGDRPLPEPGAGDIDLFLYCTQIPAREEREEALRSLRGDVAQVETGRLAGGHWGQGDCLLMAGVETWLLYFTMKETAAELEAILAGQHLDRQDSYYYPIGRCAMWKHMRLCYDPDGFLQSLQDRVAEYPAALASALITHHLQALDDVEDLERAVQRNDVLFYHFALDLALDHFLQALFALNREYFPSRKRSEQYLRNFRRKPPDCELRLREIVRLGGTDRTLEQSYRIWRALVLDLHSLYFSHEAET